MKKIKYEIGIDSRDIDLFHYLHSVKIATIGQIGRDCYYNLADPGLYKRLLRLEKVGMLQGHISSLSNRKKIYHITRKCFNNFIKKSDLKRNELKSDAIQHDLCLVEIRKTLLQSKLVNSYVTENTLQTFPIRNLGEQYEPFVRNNSDAAIKLVVNETPIYFALELELTLKNKQRISEKIKSYYSESGISRVLYVVDNSTSINSIISQEKKVDTNKKAKFFYTTYNRLIHDKDTSFSNWKKEKITF